ncbi:hypothetical protein BDA99DRAFT_518572 [Phascolomyces articulosus]|uniref:Putative zinc-finger domain-containing protein n=1 Tax=Phascolomyces articulosus TaxID=60185 RepID=A0AAD5JU22_9FUNG|nr:hypothetical protein BDA99DRAFT_518572 [Phascolomyces articulosus]
MTSQSSVDMDISEGSDLDRNSISSDMEIAHSDDEIVQSTTTIPIHTNGQQQHPGYFYTPPPPHSKPFSFGITSRNSMRQYHENSIPTGPIPTSPAVGKIPKGPAAVTGYHYYYQRHSHPLQNHQQQPYTDIPTTTTETSVSQADINSSPQQTKSVNDMTSMGTVTRPIVLDDEEDEDEIMELQSKDAMMEDKECEEDDNDSLSSYVTAPLYIVNETEEEPGLIRDEDEDDMETLGWYKHQITKYEFEMNEVKKAKRVLEQELLRLQVRHSMEKNKLMSLKKGKKKNGGRTKKTALTTPTVAETIPAATNQTSTAITTETPATNFTKQLISRPATPSPPPPPSNTTPIISSSTIKTTTTSVMTPSVPAPTSSSTPWVVSSPKPWEKSSTPEPQPLKPVSVQDNGLLKKPSTVQPHQVLQPVKPISVSESVPPKTPTKIQPRPISKPQAPVRSVKSAPVSASTQSFNTKTFKKSIHGIGSPVLRSSPLASTSSSSSPPLRTNAITEHNASPKVSINPATKKIVEHRSKGAFKPYESPLQRFGFSNTNKFPSIQYNGNSENNDNSNNNNNSNSSNFSQSGGRTSETFSMDLGRELCKYETVGGTCNDDTCQALHFRDFQQ